MADSYCFWCGGNLDFLEKSFITLRLEVSVSRRLREVGGELAFIVVDGLVVPEF